MRFNITVHADRQKVVLKVERVYLSDQVEKYKVSARNKSLILRSNRPLLRGKGLKYRRPNWKLEEGQLHNASMLNHIIDELEAFLKSTEKLP